MSKVRVLVADGHALIREGISAVLKTCEQIEVVGEATNAKEIIEVVREQAPDVVLMDITMPAVDGTKVIRQIHKEDARVKVLIVSEYEDRGFILRGLKAGGHGYIPKRATTSELVSAILAVYSKGCFLYPSVARTLVDEYLRIGRDPTPEPYDLLTEREREVLKLIAEGHSSRGIAQALHMSVSTAKGHRTRAMKKLGVHNRMELVEYAFRRHLVALRC